MEHLLITGGEEYLPFARSRIKALRAAGLTYASQQFDIEGTSVEVRIMPGQEYIALDGGLVLLGSIEGGRYVVRGKVSGSKGPWKVLSRLEGVDAPAPPSLIVPDMEWHAPPGKIYSLTQGAHREPGSTNKRGWIYIDRVTAGGKIKAGQLNFELISTGASVLPFAAVDDGKKGLFIIVPKGTFFVNLTNPVNGLYLRDPADRYTYWTCRHTAAPVDGEDPVFTDLPDLPNDYPETQYSGANQAISYIARVGPNKFCYLSLISYDPAIRGRIPYTSYNSKAEIVVTDGFTTFAKFPFKHLMEPAGLTGWSFGGEPWIWGFESLGQADYLGRGKVLFSLQTNRRVSWNADVGGVPTPSTYVVATTDYLLFDVNTGSMTRRYFPSHLDYEIPLNFPKYMEDQPPAFPKVLGAGSIGYLNFSQSGTLPLVLTYSLDEGLSWATREIHSLDAAGAPTNIARGPGGLSLSLEAERPITFDETGAVKSKGALTALLFVVDRGLMEFRTTDLGDSWEERGVVAPPDTPIQELSHIVYPRRRWLEELIDGVQP